MSITIKYAYRRHNTWIYRRAYPKHLQGVLGFALKQSLKTTEATEAKVRVAALNQTYHAIITEAEANAKYTNRTHNNTGSKTDNSERGVQLPVPRPRFGRVRLLGDAQLATLADRYLVQMSERLRPGSWKAVRFAITLLTSQLGQNPIGSISWSDGADTLAQIAGLSPNIRKYSEAKSASLPELVRLSKRFEPKRQLSGQTQARIWGHMLQFLDWCVQQGELSQNPWRKLKVQTKPEAHPHRVLSDSQVQILLKAHDRVLSSALLFGLLAGMRSGEICGLMAEDVISKGNLGRFIQVRPNAIRQLKSKAAEREVPLHSVLEALLDSHQLPSTGRLFPGLTVDAVVKAYAKLRQSYPQLQGTVFHSTRKWFITQCERTGTPEHFTATLVGHHTARSANKLTYGLYSSGISPAQKRQIVDGVRLPDNKVAGS